MTQQDFSACGVHPTCSVSMMSSGPAAPLDPPTKQYTRMQYVIPGSRSVATPVISLPSLFKAVLLAPSQPCSIILYSSSYLSTDETGLNCTEMVVCGFKKM